MAVLGVDVGGTKTLLVRLSDDGAVESRQVFRTPDGGEEELVARLCEIVESALDSDVDRIGVCLPGMVNHEAGVLLYAPQPEMRAAHLGPALTHNFRRPVVLNNDANAAVWAEFMFGAGRGHQNVLGIFVGTGVGCGVIVGGVPLRGAHGIAAEVGMMIVGVRARGGFRQLGSGTAIVAEGRERFRRLRRQELHQRGIDPESLTGEALMKLAQRGDPVARAAFVKVGEDLGSGIGTLINIFDPSVVIVGGGASAAGELLLEPARRSAVAHTYAVEERPRVPIVVAELGIAASAIGAAYLALTPSQKHIEGWPA
jgi:glucokinase